MMGYCFSSGKNNFKIKRKNIEKAYLELLNFSKNEAEFISSWRWIDFDISCSKNLFECFYNLRWELHQDGKGNVDSIEFIGDKLGNDLDIFRVIAKYVENSYIECHGEDGEKWRYVFKDCQVKEVYPKIVWE